MNPKQAFQIEQIQNKLNLSDGELIRLAREISPGCGCGLRSFADLNEDQAKQLIDVLEAIELSQIRKWIRERELVTS